MFWVIYSHTYLIFVGILSNPMGVERMINNEVMVFVVSGFYAVDVFFFMGGFFAAYAVTMKLKDTSLSILLYLKLLVFRALRIIPAYAAMILLMVKITPFFNSGPRFH